MHRCDHDDCFTCPYKDCISDVGPLRSARKKRKKMSKSEINRRYYQKKKDTISAYNRITYQEKKNHSNS